MASREDIAEQLWLRDEQEAATAMLHADDATHRLVMQRAGEPGTGFSGHNRVDELLVAAALTVLTGERRKPRRWRARPNHELSQFWREVGPHKDGRGERDPMVDLLHLLDDDH